MKKIVLFFALTLSCVFSYAQSQREFLKLSLAQANSKLPSTNWFLTFEKIDLVGEDVVFYITVDEDFLSLEEISSNYSQNKALVSSQLVSNNPELVKVIAQYGVGLKYVFSGNISKNKFEINYSYDDLVDKSSRSVDSQDFLDELLSESNQDLSMDMGYGMTMTKIFVENGYLCYNVKVDETIIPLNLLRYVEKDYVDSAILHINTVNDPAEQVLYNYLREVGFGIKYIFMSDTSSETVSVTITPEMLK